MLQDWNDCKQREKRKAASRVFLSILFFFGALDFLAAVDWSEGGWVVEVTHRVCLSALRLGMKRRRCSREGGDGGARGEGCITCSALLPPSFPLAPYSLATP